MEVRAGEFEKGCSKLSGNSTVSNGVLHFLEALFSCEARLIVPIYKNFQLLNLVCRELEFWTYSL